MNILPDLNNIGSILLEVVALILIFALVQIRGFLLRWLQAHTTDKQRETLHRLAEEAFSYAKTVYVEHDGPSKLAAAVAYLSSRLKENGITVTRDEMRAAIEKAYLAYKAITTQAAPSDQPLQIIEKEVPALFPDEVQKLISAASAFTAATSTPIPATTEQQTSPEQNPTL
jgi:hypothetical protein